MEKKLHELFSSQIDRKECFGGAAAVIENGEVVFNESFGDERFNENSIYRLASVTKLFTATAVLKLYEQGKIDIYDKASKYIPELANLSIGAIAPNGMIYTVMKPSREITLFDLLTHSAGLGSDELGNREYAVMPKEAKQSLCSACDYYAKNFHLAFEPGEKAAYSGFAGYDVLARIAEIVSGVTFNEHLQKNVCEPLSLTDTTFQPSEEQYARLVPVHKRVAGEDKEVDFKGMLFRFEQRSYEMAGASLISSMSDMIKFCKALFFDRTALGEDTIRLMLSPSLPEGLFGLPKGENNGLGCFMASGEHRLPKGTVFSHGAYGTHVIYNEKRGLAAIFLKNSFFDMSVTSRSTVAFEKAVLG